MSLKEIQEQALRLSVSDRLALMSAIVTSLQATLSPQVDKKILVDQMRGLLKTDQASPTDAEVKAMLEERLMEKYL